MRFLCFLWLLWTATGRAEEKNPLHVEMISEVSQVRAGDTFWVGFHLHHPPGHHSYWKHPGVVGVATKISWQLPAGFTAGETVWPAPEKVMMSIHPAQGYRGDVLLMVPITAPATWTEPTVTLKAELDWMCCARSCHPAHRVPFALTMKAGAEVIYHPAHQAIFEKNRQRVPRPDPLWETRAHIDATQVILRLKPAAGNPRRVEDLGDVWFFSADGAVHSAKPQHNTTLADGTLQLTMTRYEFGPQEPQQIQGVLRAEKGWHADGSAPFIEISAPLAE